MATLSVRCVQVDGGRARPSAGDLDGFDLLANVAVTANHRDGPEQLAPAADRPGPADAHGRRPGAANPEDQLARGRRAVNPRDVETRGPAEVAARYPRGSAGLDESPAGLPRGRCPKKDPTG